MLDRNELIAIVQDELKIGTLYDAIKFRGGRFEHWSDSPVVSIRTRKDHYVVSVWYRAEHYTTADQDGRRRKRKEAVSPFGETHYLDFYGRFCDGPSIGRPATDIKNSLQHVYVSLFGWQKVLADRISTLLKRKDGNPWLYRQILYAAICKHALRQETNQDIYCKHDLPDVDDGYKIAWRIYNGDGTIMLDKRGEPLPAHQYEWQAWRDAYHRRLLGWDCTVLDS